jgi:endonuclease YncB( thermonuclease family)
MNVQPRPPAFTRAQFAVLVIAGTLVIFWIVLAAVFVLTAGFDSAGASAVDPAPQQGQPAVVEQLSAPTPTLAEEPAAAAEPPLVPPTPCAQQNSGVVYAPAARVLDDGTLEVRVDGEVLNIRLASLRLPQDGLLMDQTVQEARALIEGQDVLLVKDKSEQDEEGRLVRYVFAGGQFVNYELVRQGLAHAVLDSLDIACLALLRQAEQQARGDQLGMWNPLPIPTATFMPFVSLDPDQIACDCSIRYQCSDFRTRAAAQVCYNACNDYHSRLDLDRDGIACEGLP